MSLFSPLSQRCVVEIRSCTWKITSQELLVLLKGECVAEEGRFICRCQPGWTGDECGERSYNLCQSDTCLNNATCVDDEIGFTCICNHQFTGRKLINLGLNSVRSKQNADIRPVWFSDFYETKQTKLVCCAFPETVTSFRLSIAVIMS